MKQITEYKIRYQTNMSRYKDRERRKQRALMEGYLEKVGLEFGLKTDSLDLSVISNKHITSVPQRTSRGQPLYGGHTPLDHWAAQRASRGPLGG